MKNIKFPKFTGIKCNMMPFIQGDSTTLPEIYRPYSSIINKNYLEKGAIGFLTIDESFVSKNQSQRGYNSKKIGRNLHIEVGRFKRQNVWGNSWHHSHNVTLKDNTRVLIANSISNTCRVWGAIEKRATKDGDLSDYITDYPTNTGRLMVKGELMNISIFTPHECIKQNESGQRQFFRIVGVGVEGREPYFTKNNKLGSNNEKH